MALWLVLVVAAAPTGRWVDGGLTEAEVADVIALNTPAFAPCFPGAKPKKKPAPLNHRFEVNAEGRVASADASCIGTALATLQFPLRADAGSTVEWRFTPTADAGVELEAVDVPQDELVPFDEAVMHCYDAIAPTEKTEGGVTLEFLVLRSGAIVSSAVVEQSPKFEKSSLVTCLQQRARAWQFPGDAALRRLVAHWVFATSELRAKRLYVPSAPAREIVARGPIAPGEGGLDKDVILKVISDGTGQVRYCYESELQKHRNLAGKVTVAFKIGPEGDVTEAEVAENTTGNQAVASCVIGRVKRWAFPKPLGGGFVNVTFPWIFKAAGQTDEE